MRVVVDTNVLVSGIFFGGPPRAILQAWRHRRIQIVMSPEILEEYELVGDELASRHEEIDIGGLLDLLVAHAEIVQAAPLPETVCDDPDDDKFLACALAGEVSCIVSGDKHLRRISGYQGIEVVSPRVFVDRYLAPDSA